MAQFRKKPVIINAWQFTQSSTDKPHWLLKAIGDGTVWYQGGELPYMTIKTLEGEMRASLGDWIIQGVSGELYPCKPDIFDATYEAVAA